MTAVAGPHRKLDQAAARMTAAMSAIARLLNLPAALVLAFCGQFVLGFIVMAVTPPHRLEADVGGAVFAQAALFVAQAAALLFAALRGGVAAGRLFLAFTGVVWAIASMLLVFVALQCDLAGVCL